jgi:hypothetical protein
MTSIHPSPYNESKTKEHPMSKDKDQLTLQALKHALDRLNAIPHRYADTNFSLIEKAVAAQEETCRLSQSVVEVVLCRQDDNSVTTVLHLPMPANQGDVDLGELMIAPHGLVWDYFDPNEWYADGIIAPEKEHLPEEEQEGITP